MSFERVLLAVLAGFVFLAGGGCLLAPSLFAQQAQFQTAPSALAEIRAFYGGLQLGIGLFLVWCLGTPSRTFQGLLLVGLAVGGAGLARGFGILLDQAATSHHLANLGVEVVTVAFVVIALVRIRRSALPANSISNQPATVMPAQAGIQTVCLSRCFWIPAFAGMTNPKPHRNWRAKTRRSNSTVPADAAKGPPRG